MFLAVAALVLQQGGGSGVPGFDWTQFGIVGVCLAVVGVFARQAIERERKKADEREAFFIVELQKREDRFERELQAERERHERENTRIIAQRDGLINQFFREALPALQRTSEVLSQRQAVDEQVIKHLRDGQGLFEDVRRLLESRAI